MSGKLVYRLRLWPTLAAVAGIALTLALGNWQLGRAHEKDQLKARIDALAGGAAINVSSTELNAQDVQLRRVEARGVFELKYSVFVDNRVRHGIVGYHVVTPLKVGDRGRYVLVNRGWVAGTGDRSRPPEVKTPSGQVVVSGLALLPSRRFLELSRNTMEGRVWQNLTIERYRQAMPIAIQPFVIQQDTNGAADDGLVREWDAPDLGIDMHYGYAFQWFALAAAILGYYLVTNVQRTTEKKESA